jgi:DNA (cytosine-5)-methyltransferase 1
MTKSDVKAFLVSAYNQAMIKVGSEDNIKTKLPKDITEHLDTILEHSESSKAVLTVILTSLVYKILHPKQDIRNHQTSILNGYSGRTFDSKNITPFLKTQKFPAMAESGWLTRSLEQKVPYDENYSGAIRPSVLKIAFLSTIANIQENTDLSEIFSYFLQGLIIKRNAQFIDLAKPHNVPINIIIKLLVKHFNEKYTADGASRLPVLALYAAYQCMIKELKRFDNKTLLSMESHTSADSRSGRIGDIDIVDCKNKPFEAVEVKHSIPITLQLVKDAFEKFQTTQVSRYYLLSTANIAESERGQIETEIERIKNIHGCHVIANGLISSLGYYLRLLDNTSEFISNYVNLLEEDNSLKYEHKKMWNEIISSM